MCCFQVAKCPAKVRASVAALVPLSAYGAPLFTRLADPTMVMDCFIKGSAACYALLAIAVLVAWSPQCCGHRSEFFCLNINAIFDAAFLAASYQRYMVAIHSTQQADIGSDTWLVYQTGTSGSTHASSSSTPVICI
jgi:hypothetical protein